jgi:hypothetical protein
MPREGSAEGREERLRALQAELFRTVVDTTRQRRRSLREHAARAGELRDLYERNRNVLESLPNE